MTTHTPRYMVLLDVDYYARRLLALGMSENDAYAMLESGLDLGLSAADIVASLEAVEENAE